MRIAFCDAPEKLQAFGTRAKQAMSELAFGKEIELRKHAIDRYGRTVAQVFVDGKDVGLEMLRQGFAWVYDRYITEASTEVQETYRKAQEEAKAEQRGLWSDPNSIPPWIFRNLAKANEQQTIASNWIKAHRKSADSSSCSCPAPPIASKSPLSPDDVWVNTKSGRYWKPVRPTTVRPNEENSCPKDAVQNGYLPANGTRSFPADAYRPDQKRSTS